jgi:hypothetical protein
MKSIHNRIPVEIPLHSLPARCHIFSFCGFRVQEWFENWPAFSRGWEESVNLFTTANEFIASRQHSDVELPITFSEYPAQGIYTNFTELSHVPLDFPYLPCRPLFRKNDPSVSQFVATSISEMETCAVFICAWHYCRLYPAAKLIAHLYQSQYT